MAVIQLMSDEHLEFLPQGIQGPAFGRYVEGLDPEGVDVLVLAGDICLFHQYWKVLPEFCRRYPQVVFVPGNHEFYGSIPRIATDMLRDTAAKLPNLVLFEGKARDVAGLKMVGVTLWFPRPTDRVRGIGRGLLADFGHIYDFEPWVYGQHAEDLEFLKNEAPGADVVITHHIPTRRCIAPRFREGREGEANHFFCYDLTEEIAAWQPKLWCFGHTHDRMTTRIGRTIVTANPRGYPNEREEPERGRYLQRCLIEVDGDGARFLNGEPGPGLAEDRCPSNKA